MISVSFYILLNNNTLLFSFIHNNYLCYRLVSCNIFQSIFIYPGYMNENFTTSFHIYIFDNLYYLCSCLNLFSLYKLSISPTYSMVCQSVFILSLIHIQMCIRDRLKRKRLQVNYPFPLTDLHQNRKSLRSLQFRDVCKNLFDSV